MLRIQKVTVKAQRATLEALHTLTFPSDEQPQWDRDGLALLVYDAGEPVAFLYATEEEDGAWYFSRVGVMFSHRGQGLQRKLMRRMYKELKGRKLISTTYYNPTSANNFVREQWLTWLPAKPWGCPDTIYWYKQL